MTIDAISNGVVIDHIPAGKAMVIYKNLKLDQKDCSIAVLQNVSSVKQGRKDIIKIDEEIELDLDVLGYLAPNCTVNIIRNGVNVEKRHLTLPEKLVDVIFCRNPRCITTVEQGIHHVFRLTNAEKGIYRCIYCEAKA